MPYSYKLTMSDQNVAAGKNLIVVGMSLMSNETLTFDGSGETNGSYNVRGGKGGDTIVTGARADQLYGNLGADLLSGGAGNDVFEYYSVAESTRTEWDTILDFNRGDKINLINIDAVRRARRFSSGLKQSTHETPFADLGSQHSRCMVSSDGSEDRRGTAPKRCSNKRG